MEKEICVSYQSFQDNVIFPFKDTLYQKLDVMVICYKYGTWEISRGPFNIPGVMSNVKTDLYFYQKSGSDVVLVLAGYKSYYLDSQLTRVIKVDAGYTKLVDSASNLYGFQFDGTNIFVCKFNERQLNFDRINLNIGHGYNL
jgi:hypothetical protein